MVVGVMTKRARAEIVPAGWFGRHASGRVYRPALHLLSPL